MLPFSNLTGDAEQEYFADGIVEALTIALSRFKSLFVIARNSAGAYKGRPIDLRQVGNELGVEYVLEGSVRRSANHLRIGVQLANTQTGTQVWADRYDGELKDVFHLQDEMTKRVVGSLLPRLEEAEIDKSLRRHQPGLDAYDLYLRALPLHRGSNEENDQALTLLKRAEALDPSFAMAYGLACRCYHIRRANGWMRNIQEEVCELQRVADLALKIWLAGCRNHSRSCCSTCIWDISNRTWRHVNRKGSAVDS